MKAKRMLWVVLSILLVSSMLFVACKPKATEEVEESTTEEEELEAEGSLYERAMDGEFDGKVVTMTGPFTDEDAVKFDNSVAAFEEATGIDIQYEGSKEFEATISVRVEAGDPPDIVDFPQPGLLATFVSQGKVVDVSTFLPESSFDNYIDSWWEMATMESPDGPIVAGVWHRFFGKSQVWYPKEDFDAAGYEIPETWDEMLALSDQIVADGDKPWCVGIESGAATGWPATDWMEEVMLRTTSLENYDKWTTGELPFNSPEVRHALEVLAELWADEYVYGGREAIVTTSFGDAPTPMFEDPPKCWLHKQGNFITSFFPEGVEAGTDYSFFYLPPIDEEYGKPYLVSGDLMAMFNDRPEVRVVMEFFTHGESLKEWMASGGGLSPHKDAQLDWYGDDIERGIAELVKDSDSVRFDGSDLMPGEVGSGSFWTGMTDYFSGTADMDTVMEEIDASWPAGGEEPAEEEETEEEAAPSGELEIFSWWAGDEGPALEALINLYNEKYPDVEVVNATVAGGSGVNAKAVLKTRLLGGDPPDTFQVHAGQELIGTWVVEDTMEDLSFLYEKNGWFEKYPQGLIDLMSTEDGIWSVPVNIHRSNVLWYIPENLDAWGVDVPQTWDDFLAICPTLQDEGVVPLSLGANWTHNHLWEAVAIAELGVDGWNALWTGEKSWTDEDVVATWDKFGEILECTNEDATTISWQQASDMVINGEAAFNEMGDWANGYFETTKELVPNEDYAWSAAPGTEGVFVALSDSFGLPKGAPNREAVVAWLSLMGSVEGQDTFNPLKGSIAAHEDSDLELYSAYSQSAAKDWKSNTVVASLAHGAAANETFMNGFSSAMEIFLSSGNSVATAEALQELCVESGICQ